MVSLALLIEGSPCAWGSLGEEHGADVFKDIIRALVSYSNAHLAMSTANSLLMLGFGVDAQKQTIFDSRAIAKPGAIIDTSRTIVNGIRNVIGAGISAEDDSATSPLAATLSRAICFLNSQSKSFLDPDLATDEALESCAPKDCRVLIVSMRGEPAHERSSLLNLFFTANKHNICVDVAAVGSEPSPLLQQAADITGGTCLRLAQPKELLQALMTHALGPTASRSFFVTKDDAPVDYRAACACHNQLVDQAMICSVCLAVMCKFIPICKSCGAIFPVKVPLRTMKKRPGGGSSAAAPPAAKKPAK